jgi:NAD+-dependent protein deacetylase sirtuin 6
MKSGFPLNRLAELHGNMFIEKCNVCGAKNISTVECVKTIGFKSSGKKCSRKKQRGNCRLLFLIYLFGCYKLLNFFFV